MAQESGLDVLHSRSCSIYQTFEFTLFFGRDSQYFITNLGVGVWRSNCISVRTA